MTGRHLAITADVRVPPPDRGRLLDPDAVVREIFSGNQEVSRAWVVRNVKGPGSGRVKLGRKKVAFWEYDVRRWLEQRTEAA
jgi:hypothetical protein